MGLQNAILLGSLVLHDWPVLVGGHLNDLLKEIDFSLLTDMNVSTDNEFTVYTLWLGLR